MFKLNLSKGLVNFEKEPAGFLSLIHENRTAIDFLEVAFGVKIKNSDSILEIIGTFENVELVKRVFKILFMLLKHKPETTFNEIKGVVSFVKCGKLSSEFFDSKVFVTHKKEVVVLKNFNQMFYRNAIENNAITFGVGPAGTGKTFLAATMAVLSFKQKLCDKIVFTRPVLEAGENLGFLPGNLQSKVEPFLQPLYDSVCELIGFDSFSKNLARGFIEVVPLAYMRGRSLNNSFIVLDEAQNTTVKQMKMFLTRLGFNSKMVITGDLTQVDLKDKNSSGLFMATRILKNVENIEIVNFENSDVVRNPIVKKILDAFENLN